LTAIYVTHDQKEALSISDRMAILESGHIAQIGSPAEVYRRPHSRVVADFIGETNFLQGTLRSAGDGLWRVETDLGEFTGSPGDPSWQPAVGEKVTLSIRPECWTIRETAGAENCARGRVGDSVYLGEVAQYAFRAGDHQLKIFELNPRHESLPGDHDFFACVAPEDVVVVRP
jgi:iron(III) transport system ATP-binding protein